MQIIPSINTTDFEGVKKRIKEIKGLGIDWGHIDVADGKFTPTVLWNNPKELQASGIRHKINLEVHLMVVNPDDVVKEWVLAGVKRIVVHLESAKDIDFMIRQCKAAGVDLALAVNPDTPVKGLLRYRDRVRQVLVLTVSPGPAGQQFRPDQVGKIKTLQVKMPNVNIEVDGGINLETAKLCKDAGADIFVSASYIFNSPNPKKAYQRLKAV